MSAELRHLHVFPKPTHQSGQHRATCASWHWNVQSLHMNAGGTEGALGRKKAYIPDMFPFSCFFRCLSRLVCWPKHLSHKWHLNGFSLLWMLRTCLCRLEDMLKDLSQYLHLKKNQNKWVEKGLLVAGNIRFVLRDMKHRLDSATVLGCSSLVPIEGKPSLKQVLAE